MRLKAVLLALLVVSWGIVVWLAVRTSRQDAVIGSLERRLRAAQTRVLPPPAPNAPPAPTSAAPKPAQPPVKESGAEPEPEVDPEMEALKAKLQDSGASLAKSQARVNELESEVLNVMGDRAHAVAAANGAFAKISEMNRALETMKTECSAVEKRMRDLEAENGRLRDQSNGAAQKNTVSGQLSAELHDITRRQQVSVTDILRRYHEVTDMFRSLPGTMDSRGGPEVSRIQTAISMADEDARQLKDLSARLDRLEKRIAAADKH